MKFFNLIFIAVCCLFLSCEEKEAAQPVARLLRVPQEKGTVPDAHPVNLMMLTADRYTFREVHQMYKKDIEPVVDAHYTSNLKNFGFRLAVQTGLLKDGTNQEKQYYLDEQMSLDVNVLNFDDFYRLLSGSQDFLGLKEVNRYANVFYDKNAAQIATFQVDDAKKEELLLRLTKARSIWLDLTH